MKILMLYATTSKSTEKITQALLDRFSRDGHDVTALNVGERSAGIASNKSRELLQNADIVGIGSPVFHLRILDPMDACLRNALPDLRRDARAFLYLTYGGISSGLAFRKLLKELERHGIAVIGGLKVCAPHFYNHGVYPDEQALQTVEEFYRRLSQSDFKPIPWSRAWRLFSYQGAKVRMIYPFAKLAGRMRRLPIRFDNGKCIQCKRCRNECPAGAIRLEQTLERDSKQCIYCYRCVTVCPKQALICPTEKVSRMVETNKRLLGCEQPPNGIYL